MSYHLLNELSGSSLFPTRRWLDREDFHSLAEKTYLTMMAIRILLCVSATADMAEAYVHRTIQTGNFHSWRSNGTDLYVLLWALTQGGYEPEKGVPDYIAEQQFVRWLKALDRDGEDMVETKRLFLRLDSVLHIHDSSMSAIRRIVQDFPHASHYDRQLAFTRLLQMIRSRMPRSELLAPLGKAARHHDLELKGVCDLETGDGCGNDDHHGHHHEPKKKKKKTPGTALGFLAGLAGVAAGMAASRALSRESVQETASSGATSAASVASVVGGLGAGFDPNGHKGIYDTKKPKRTAILRRPPIA